MCGRFTTIGRAILLHFKLGLQPLVRPPRYNIAPTQFVPVVVQEAGAAPVAQELYWGLVPSWAQDRSVGVRGINARVETVDAKASFRNAFKSRRCLIPASGFYEWQAGAGKTRTPYYFTARNEETHPLVFAGLWEDWNVTGQPLRSFTIITTEANGTVEPIHHRMPAILHPDDWERWLDPDIRNAPALKALLRPAPDHILASWRVSPHVSNPRNDGGECIVPVDEAS